MEIQHYSNKKSFNPSFSADVTKAILKEIENTDTIAISNKLLKSGVKTDFDNNKTIASSCNKRNFVKAGVLGYRRKTVCRRKESICRQHHAIFV